MKKRSSISLMRSEYQGRRPLPISLKLLHKSFSTTYHRTTSLDSAGSVAVYLESLSASLNQAKNRSPHSFKTGQSVQIIQNTAVPPPAASSRYPSTSPLLPVHTIFTSRTRNSSIRVKKIDLPTPILGLIELRGVTHRSQITFQLRDNLFVDCSRRVVAHLRSPRRTHK